MRYLILCLLIVGCGADPDDFKIQESDGCRSDDIECQEKVKEASDAASTEEENSQEDNEESDTEMATGTTPEPEGDEITVNVSVDVDVTINKVTGETSASGKCLPNKLCRGMSRQEVHDIMGDPHSTGKPLFGNGDLYWEWREDPGTEFYCADARYGHIVEGCRLFFNEITRGGIKYTILVGNERIRGDWIDVVNY